MIFRGVSKQRSLSANPHFFVILLAANINLKIFGVAATNALIVVGMPGCITISLISSTFNKVTYSFYDEKITGKTNKPEPLEMFLTVGLYILNSGRSPQGYGIIPDFHVSRTGEFIQQLAKDILKCSSKREPLILTTDFSEEAFSLFRLHRVFENLPKRIGFYGFHKVWNSCEKWKHDS